MELEVVKAFNTELASLYETKPPISKKKMTDITKSAMKAIKYYKHVVLSVEKFIQKCRSDYKIPGLYVIDSIVRQSRHQFGPEKEVFAPRFAKNLSSTFEALLQCSDEDKPRAVRVLNLWLRGAIFTEDALAPCLEIANKHGLETDALKVEIAVKGEAANVDLYKAKVQSAAAAAEVADNVTVVNKTLSSAIEMPAAGSTPIIPGTPNMVGGGGGGTQLTDAVDRQLLQQIELLTNSIVNAQQQQQQAAVVAAKQQSTRGIKTLLAKDYEYSDESGEEDGGAPEEPTPSVPVHDTAKTVEDVLRNPLLLHQLQQMQQQQHLQPPAAVQLPGVPPVSAEIPQPMAYHPTPIQRPPPSTLLPQQIPASTVTAVSLPTSSTAQATALQTNPLTSSIPMPPGDFSKPPPGFIPFPNMMRLPPPNIAAVGQPIPPPIPGTLGALRPPMLTPQPSSPAAPMAGHPPFADYYGLESSAQKRRDDVERGDEDGGRRSLSRRDRKRDRSERGERDKDEHIRDRYRDDRDERHHPTNATPSRKKKRSRSRSRDKDADRDDNRRRDKKRSRHRTRSRSKGRDRGEREDKSSRKRSKRSSSPDRERRKKGFPPVRDQHVCISSRTLWFGRLPQPIVDEDIKEAVKSFGDVYKIDLMAPRGCAYVTMADRRSAVKVLDRMSSGVINGKVIKVSWAPGKTIKTSGFAEDWSSDEGALHIPWNRLAPLDLSAYLEENEIDLDTLPDHLKDMIGSLWQQKVKAAENGGAAATHGDSSFGAADFHRQPPSDNHTIGQPIAPGTAPSMNNPAAVGASTSADQIKLPPGAPPPNAAGAPPLIRPGGGNMPFMIPPPGPPGFPFPPPGFPPMGMPPMMPGGMMPPFRMRGPRPQPLPSAPVADLSEQQEDTTEDRQTFDYREHDGGGSFHDNFGSFRGGRPPFRGGGPRPLLFDGGRGRGGDFRGARGGFRGGRGRGDFHSENYRARGGGYGAGVEQWKERHGFGNNNGREEEVGGDWHQSRHGGDRMRNGGEDESEPPRRRVSRFDNGDEDERRPSSAHHEEEEEPLSEEQQMMKMMGLPVNLGVDKSERKQEASGWVATVGDVDERRPSSNRSAIGDRELLSDFQPEPLNDGKQFDAVSGGGDLPQQLDSGEPEISAMHTGGVGLYDDLGEPEAMPTGD